MKNTGNNKEYICFPVHKGIIFPFEFFIITAGTGILPSNVSIHIIIFIAISFVIKVSRNVSFCEPSKVSLYNTHNR